MQYPERPAASGNFIALKTNGSSAWVIAWSTHFSPLCWQVND
jgi:hypothetical protein